MTDAVIEQPELLPATPPTFKSLTVRPDELPPNDLLDGPEPSEALINSIHQFGLVDPIVVRPVAEGLGFAYSLVSGSRRVKAIRHLLAEMAAVADVDREVKTQMTRLSKIPARLVETMGDAPADVLVIQANTLRSRNKAAEYKSVRRLLDAGADEKAIARATGLTAGQIKELLRLDSLNETLLDAMGDGKLTATQAHEIARLPAASQERLVETFAENGKLTATDVHAERQARQENAAQTMDWSAITAVPATVEAEPEPEADPEPVAALDADDYALKLVGALGQLETPGYIAEIDLDGITYVVTVAVKEEEAAG